MLFGSSKKVVGQRQKEYTQNGQGKTLIQWSKAALENW